MRFDHSVHDPLLLLRLSSHSSELAVLLHIHSTPHSTRIPRLDQSPPNHYLTTGHDFPFICTTETIVRKSLYNPQGCYFPQRSCGHHCDDCTITHTLVHPWSADSLAGVDWDLRVPNPLYFQSSISYCMLILPFWLFHSTHACTFSIPNLEVIVCAPVSCLNSPSFPSTRVHIYAWSRTLYVSADA